MKKKQLTIQEQIKEQLKQEMRDAIQEKRDADDMFNWADTEYIEAAILRMQAAELNLRYVCKRSQTFEKETGMRIMEPNELLDTSGMYQDLNKTRWSGEEN